MKRKINFAVVLIALILMLGLFTFLLINCINLYSEYDIEKTDVHYEVLTFEKYDYVKRYRTNDYYEIYFTEYEKPFIIDGIVKNKVDKDRLDELKSGQACFVYFDETSNRNFDYEICELHFGNKSVLSFDDYVDENRSNQLLGICFMPFLLLLCVFLIFLAIKIFIGTSPSRQHARGRLKLQYNYKGHLIQIYNSTTVCSLVIDGKVVDEYLGVVGYEFTLFGEVDVMYEKVLIEAKMGYLFIRLYINEVEVKKAFMGLG